MAKNFYLFKRATRRKPVYYVQFRGEGGARSTAISTGQTSKSAAETWAIDFLRKGGSLPTAGRQTFGQYSADWWRWEGEKPQCPYIKGKLARGFNISRGYAAVRRSYLDRYVLPEFKDVKLSAINPRMIEAWVMRMKDAGNLAPATINRILGTLKVQLAEAVRLQIIPLNPASVIGELAERPQPRGILGIEIMGQLFDPAEAARVWGDPRHRVANYLAAAAGLRLGEVQGLMLKYIHPTFIEIRHSWDDRYGLSSPKWGSTGEAPIPTKVSAAIQDLIRVSPYRDDEESFLIWGKDGRHPLSKTALLAGFRRALERVGISLEEQKKRVLCFHSWRHNANTIYRGRVSDEQLRRLTRHKTLSLTDHYDHAGIEHMADVAAVQETLFS